MKLDNSLKQDKGVAGLTILLSIVTMLFVIGLLVFIFSLMGGSLSDATYTSTTSSIVNDSLTTVNEVGENFAVFSYRNVVCSGVTCLNATDGITIPSANYTVTNCHVGYSGVAGLFNNTNWKCSYSYIYDANNTATEVISETTSGIAGVTDWYSIFIVISAMVVLILLTVIIITAIRGSGLMEGSSSGSGGTIGSA